MKRVFERINQPGIMIRHTIEDDNILIEYVNTETDAELCARYNVSPSRLLVSPAIGYVFNSYRTTVSYFGWESTKQYIRERLNRQYGWTEVTNN